MFREELTYLLFPYFRRVSLLQSFVNSDVVQLAVHSCSLLSVVSVVKWRHHGLLRNTCMAAFYVDLCIWIPADWLRCSFIWQSDKSDLELR